MSISLFLFFATIALMIGLPIKIFLGNDPASKWGKIFFAAGLDLFLFSQVLLDMGLSHLLDLPLPVIVPPSPLLTYLNLATMIVGGLLAFLGKRLDSNKE